VPRPRDRGRRRIERRAVTLLHRRSIRTDRRD
jgi:hypothetical protein